MKTVSIRLLLLVFIPAILVLVAIVIARIWLGISIPAMTRDVTAIANIHPLSGILSNLGILLWCATASLCLFVALTFRHVLGKENFGFFLGAAVLSGYLVFDDFFQLHEILLPKYLGLREEIVYMLLGLTTLAYLVRVRKIVWRTPYSLLLSALGFFALSIFLDAILETWVENRIGDWEYLCEDGAKWLGIASWCGYYVYTAYQVLGGIYGLSGNALPAGTHMSSSDCMENEGQMPNKSRKHTNSVHTDAE